MSKSYIGTSAFDITTSFFLMGRIGSETSSKGLLFTTSSGFIGIASPSLSSDLNFVSTNGVLSMVFNDVS
ncbi:hypothetical protein AR158_c500L [Paramecium bursaria Chlorella virus AR158]|uniref:hypothetical protein n=1 Tax=Paramecium bursaria Chlorella virus AR158 TaxID=380598 RepID=UPI00015AA722|nr:hypothetical protein AR158_c500L [Paramecium bursaria Chlorella virus AR158]ABU44045.1 hypothetical protein AR158_c500L [Paramecium bursaria Chlorella virus AR158]